MRWFWAAAAAILIAGSAGAQVQYASGQNVAPVFEGWEQNPDGSYNMVFGYLNRNYEEEVDIPLGPENSITVDGQSYGDKLQPTHFYPRRQRFLFRVVIPKDWDKNKRVVWTLTSRGRTDKANGWLQPEWELSKDVIVENLGGGVPDENNKPPTLVTSDSQTIAAGSVLTITASASDDGLPKPYKRATATAGSDRDAQPKRPQGVQIKWIVYRAAGKVKFEQDSSPVIHGEPVALTSKVTFSAPGTYVLRATANDGQLYTTKDITITVK
jgi:hypothetical protein